MSTRGPLPFMKTMEEAVALCEKEQDNFYVTAFLIEAWLGDAVLEAATEYAEKKNAKDRAMQAGQAWRGFLEYFGHAKTRNSPMYGKVFCGSPNMTMFKRGCFPGRLFHFRSSMNLTAITSGRRRWMTRNDLWKRSG